MNIPGGLNRCHTRTINYFIIVLWGELLSRKVFLSYSYQVHENESTSAV